jgi:predicted Zn-dependent protease
MDIEALKQLIGTHRDSALLRISIATALVGEDRASEAEEQLTEAARMDPHYTAAWKQLGKVRLLLDDTGGARKAWWSGIEAARANGDKQAEKEMTVFLRRLDKKPS